MISDKTKEKYLNKTFGKLHTKDIYQKNGVNFCVCSCECGNKNYHIRSCDLKNAKSCGCIKSGNGKLRINKNIKKLVGKVFQSNNDGEFEVIEYANNSNVKVRFIETNFETNVHVSQVYSGEIKDLYKPKQYGQYIGKGEFKTHYYKNGKKKPTFEYNKWRWMLLRCYDEKELTKEPSYIGCSVCDEWMNFQNFAAWIQSNKYECEDLELDKDLLVKNNKIYSPSNCCLLPHEINYAISMCDSADRHLFLINKYKDVLPKHIYDVYEKFVNDLTEVAK